MNSPNCRKSTTRSAATRILASAIALLWASAAAAANPFNIDGVVPDTGALSFLDPSGSAKELGAVNASNTKLGAIHTASPPMLEFTNPNSSTDLSQIWLRTAKDANGDIWLYFAWARDANTGSSVVSYEFQSAAADPACNYGDIDQVEPIDAAESALIAACNPWSNRRTGDFVIVWDFNGGATDVILRTFSGTSFDVGANLSASGFAIAALNSDSTRGEGAINLSDAIFGQLESCFNVANVISGTVTGNSDQSDYKDTLLADISSAVTISNCGILNVTKATVPPGETGTFAYTLDRVGGSAIDYSARKSASGTLVDDGGTDQLTLIPGRDYRLDEDLTGEPNFLLNSILCDRPAPNMDGSRGFAVEISDTTNCVITNELLLGTITVVKEVVNGFGGRAVPSDFCLSLNDSNNTASFPGDSNGTQFTFLQGDEFSVTEVPCGSPDTSPKGYEASYSGECNGAIAALTDKVCTVTNTQEAQSLSRLTLRKDVVNNNGGTATSSDWTLSARLKSGAPAACTATGFSGADDGTNGVTQSVSVSDGLAQCRYVLSESGGPASGYTPGAWSCAGDYDLSGNEVTVGSGGATCTLTNNDNAPSLTLVKQVVNNNGGTLQASAWTLGAAGPTPISGAGGASSGATFSAGTYSLSETGPAGYSASAWSCVGGTQSGSNVTLALGQSATCTLTNNDNAPSLTLVKQVVNNNGGTQQASAWTLSAAGPTPISGAGGASSGATFSAGTYSLSETGPAGYSASAWSCVGGTQSGSNITLALGQSATCTLTNNDIQPVLTVVKIVANDNGGVLTASDFPLYVGDVRVTTQTPTGFNAGSYVVSETNQPGYQAGNWGGACSANGAVNLSVGQDKTCTITNSDIPPELKIIKTPDGFLSIPGVNATFTITVKNVGGGDARNVTLTDTLPSPTEGGLPKLNWTTTKAGCAISDGVTLSCNIGLLPKDPTPNQRESGDEASYTVTVSAAVPTNYLLGNGVPSGPGTLGSHFEIDGNLVADAGGSVRDWGSSGFEVINKLDPPLVNLSPKYLADDSFVDGAKENDAVPTILDQNVPPNKSDLANFLIARDTVDGHAFLLLGWLRANSLGTANFDFELNQSAEMSANGATPPRTTGDVLFSFDFESSGNNVVLTMREWNGDSQLWGPPRSLDGEGLAAGAVNDPEAFGTSSNGETNPFTGAVLLNQTFGEAIFNLTRIFAADCRVFASGYVKGRSSTPFTAVLKDFIAPVPTQIDTCRSVRLPNTAWADATNPGQEPVSDQARIDVSNDPILRADTDRDGILNYADLDDDQDKVLDDTDNCPLVANSTQADTDGDGIGNACDYEPGLLTIPASDKDGVYVVSWGVSGTPGVTYVLEEATNASFTKGLRVAYQGPGLSATISGRGELTYYYRVKSQLAGNTDSAWVTGGNGCVVTLAPATSVTLTPSVASPATVGTPVTFTAAASGGTGIYEYMFLLRAPGGTLNTIRAYSSTTTWTWNTTGAVSGTYQVVVRARSAGSIKSYETYQSISYVLAPPPVSAVTLTPSVASPVMVGTPVTFTAAASGGSGSYEYKYLLRLPGGSLSTVRDYSTTSTWTWSTTGLPAGTYQVVVHARNVGSTKSYESYKSISYVLASPPASAVTLTPSVVSPATIGTAVTFTAAASGGSGSYEYTFLLRAPGGTLNTAQAYASTPTWTWNTTGAVSGTYQVVVRARNAGSTVSYDTYQSISYALSPP